MFFCLWQRRQDVATCLDVLHTRTDTGRASVQANLTPSKRSKKEKDEILTNHAVQHEALTKSVVDIFASIFIQKYT